MMQYNTTYQFDLSETVAFGSLAKEIIYDLFKDGRVASNFLERQITIWFPEFEFVGKTGYDHVRDFDGRKLDMKSFTKHGCNYAPSNMVGKGRKLNEELLHSHANSIDYLICDITEFPKVRIRMVEGSFLVHNYPFPKPTIPYKHKKTFFD